MTKNFTGGIRHVIYPWNQSQIENLKSSLPPNLSVGSPLKSKIMEAKDLDVQVTAEAVAISGERRSQTKTEDKGITRSEFRYGSFRRVIPLPARVQNDSVQAEYKNGVLNLTLPKAEAEKNRVVKVELS
ncbi:MAG: Hsp20/alpha crystallin family protein [Oscillatoriales cyanobacterium]|nr:MAG: Hsp20/alpha crystallin family protein [Oscillatoriales cyanobacterium]